MLRYVVSGFLVWCCLAWSSVGYANDFRVVIVSAKVLPTKKDRRCWDVCMTWDQGGLFQLSRKLLHKKGPKAWKRVISSTAGATLLRGPKMPDPYARLRFSNGQTITTKTDTDTLRPRWGASGRVSLRPGDSLEIEVWDKDLRNDDLIGRFPTKRIPAKILSKGGLWTVRFEQVYTLTLKFVKVPSPSGGLFVPGLYEVTILHAKIHHMRKDGKPWDPWKGLPDPFVTLRFGRHSVTTPVERNTLSPSWSYTGRVYLNGNEKFTMSIWDSDLRNHDTIGTCSYSTIAQLPLDARGRYRSQCHLAKEITIKLKKIR